MKGNKPLKWLFVLYLILLHAAAAYLGYEWLSNRNKPLPEFPSSPPNKQPANTPLTRPSPTISDAANVGNANAIKDKPQAPGWLIIPVAGVKPEQLVDSFNDARSEGRVHDAIDIQAPVGTPVVAAADGVIAKFFDSEAGGITIYQTSEDRKLIYYYAHLQSRAGNLNVGDTVTHGRLIGFVGDTGNAGAGNYHLHFSISIAGDPKRYWEGTPVNPFSYLQAGTVPLVP